MKKLFTWYPFSIVQTFSGIAVFATLLLAWVGVYHNYIKSQISIQIKTEPIFVSSNLNKPMSKEEFVSFNREFVIVSFTHGFRDYLSKAKLINRVQLDRLRLRLKSLLKRIESLRLMIPCQMTIYNNGENTQIVSVKGKLNLMSGNIRNHDFKISNQFIEKGKSKDLSCALYVSGTELSLFTFQFWPKIQT